jgi:branched-chain amino acid transport system substrate-binding protein
VACPGLDRVSSCKCIRRGPLRITEPDTVLSLLRQHDIGLPIFPPRPRQTTIRGCRRSPGAANPRRPDMTVKTPSTRRWPLGARFTTVALAGALCSLGAQAQETFKVGIVSFLSGQAAESFGIPAVNGAKVLLDAFNKGAAPAPYNKVGVGGMKLEFVYVDENGGATKQVQELRNLYDREKVDAVVGYVGSGDCLAVAPVAEEMKKFLILYDCGTPRIFEDGKYQYVFRTASHAAMDNVALGRYLKARNVKVDSFNMINQDYAWGQDSKKDFT